LVLTAIRLIYGKVAVMASVFDVARYIISIFSDKAEYGLDDGMTNLRLQKLLYLAQGYYLAEYGRPLFNDDIEAWQYGPVVRDVYVKYSPFKSGILQDVPPEDGSLADDEEEMIIRVLGEFGKYSAGYLVNLTHAPGTPWDMVYDGEKRKIGKDRIKEYFSTGKKLTGTEELAERFATESAQKRGTTGHIVLPSDDYEEWEDSPDA